MESEHRDAMAIIVRERDSLSNKLEAVKVQLRVVTAADAEKAAVIVDMKLQMNEHKVQITSLQAQVASMHVLEPVVHVPSPGGEVRVGPLHAS